MKLLAWFGRRKRREQDLDDEIRAHLTMAICERIEQGESPAEAEANARREFGNAILVKEITRDMWASNWLESLAQDLRYGLRQLRRNPGFTAVAVITLALGIGANTAIFSVVNAVFRRGLPAYHPGQLLGLSFHQKGSSGQYTFSYPDFEDIRKQAGCFSDMFAYHIGLDGLNEGTRTDQIITSFVTGNYFTALGLRPALGRLLLPTEGKVPGSDPVLVLGYSYWRERFGGDPGVIGKQVQVDGHAITIVGVAPRGFRGLFSVVDIQVYLPINMFFIEGRDRGWANSRASRSLYLMGLLEPSVSPRQAQASLDVIASRMARQYPKDWQRAVIETYPGKAANSLVEPSRRTYELEGVAVALFLALAGLVLLLACFNVVNLLLVRATAREHEMVVRAALGASRSRLIRQLLSESLLLALLGGVAGVALGRVASTMLSSIHLRAGIPIRLDFGFDWRVFAFALACAVLAGMIVGILPAIRASGVDPGDSLHEGGRSIAAGGHYIRNGLVISQLAGSMVLLTFAGLFIRSLQKASAVSLGFDAFHVVNMSMDPHDVGYDESREREFGNDLLTRVRALPGVRSACLAYAFPAGEYSEYEEVYVEGHLPPPGQAGPTIFDNSVSPGYFKTMGIPIVEGRSFEETDKQSAPRVAIVNQTMARAFWPNDDPVGKRFKLSSDSDTWIQIVGVARDSKVQDLTATVPAYFYLPLDQDYSKLITLQVRTAGPPESIVPRIENQIHRLAPGLPVFGVQTMGQALNGPNGFLHYWLGSALGTALGLLGLIVSVVGVYGVISYSASQRTHEIGIRMALGAQPGDIGKMVFGQGLRLVAAGVLLGLVAAVAAVRVMAGLLFGITAYDPLTFAAVAFLLVGVALLGCYVPARRATKVDPMEALRYE
ncbi:MAG TPA: ABC transporter permease [Terriglobia bacterium]|nr:ABC transporter permease [Terriglobia bacterium]